MTDRELMQMALDAIEGFYPSLTELHNAHTKTAEALRARLAQPEPEPVAWMHDSHVGFNVPLYTAPPQREWQGLTDEEIDQAAWPYFIGNILPSVKLIVRQLEAKLKEKNSA